MSDGFELSFKNKEVRMWLLIMIPTMIAEFMMISAENGYSYFRIVLPFLSWSVFFIWRYLYRRNLKKESSFT